MKMSQVEVAKAIGVAGPVISGWETGKNPLPPERYADVMKVLKFDPKRFPKVILRYSNPHLFDLMFPGEDTTIPKELASIGVRYFLPYGIEDDEK